MSRVKDQYIGYFQTKEEAYDACLKNGGPKAKQHFDCGTHIEIELKQGGQVTIVDHADYHKVKNIIWSNRSGYVSSSNNGAMHRLILGLDSNSKLDSDHINRNKLDNRSSNLRSCNRSQNCMNRSVFKSNSSGTSGVSFDKKTNKWWVRIQFNGKRKSLGYFSDIEDAKKCRDAAVAKYHKEFAAS